MVGRRLRRAAAADGQRAQQSEREASGHAGLYWARLRATALRRGRLSTSVETSLARAPANADPKRAGYYADLGTSRRRRDDCGRVRQNHAGRRWRRDAEGQVAESDSARQEEGVAESGRRLLRRQRGTRRDRPG